MAAEEKIVKAPSRDEEGRRPSGNMEPRQYGKGNGVTNSLRESVFEAVLDVHQLLNEAEGYLGKKSPNGFFQNRYFVAYGHYLKYFKYEKDASNIDYCLAAIDIKLVTITDPYGEKTALGTSKEKRLFDIIFPDGDEKVVLKAEKGDGAQRWVDALRKMKEAPLPVQDNVEDRRGTSDEIAETGSDDDDVEGDAVTSYADIQALTKATLEAASLVTTRVPRRKAIRRKSSAETELDTTALKPKKGEVNEVDRTALSTTAAGLEREVRKRHSLTARACWAEGCEMFHMRDSPFCHDHAHIDTESNFKTLEGTSIIEEQINRAVQRALDHKPPVAPDAIAVGEKLHASLPVELQNEFALDQGGALELYQLRRQFQALFDDDDDGTISATEILNSARKAGDLMDESKLNVRWAQVMISGILGTKDANGDMLLDPNASLDFSHFVQCVATQRSSRGTDLASIAARARYCLQGKGEKGNDMADPDSDDDDEGGEGDAIQSSAADLVAEAAKDDDASKWLYPVIVPEGAVPDIVLTIPLPGNEIAYCPVLEGKNPGDTMFVPMTEVSVSACLKAASVAAANASGASSVSSSAAVDEGLETSSDSGGMFASMMGMFSKANDEDVYQPKKPSLKPGPGADYCAMRGRKFFCTDVFSCLREAASRAAELPPLEGWMLKRGNKMASGNLNSWRLRYFRQEGPELVYYKKRPGKALAESNISRISKTSSQNAEVAQANAAEAMDENSNELTDEGKVAALAEAIPQEEFQDKNLKGAINLREIVGVLLSTKTSMSISAAKMYFAATGESPESQLAEAIGGAASPRIGKVRNEEYADGMIVFKVYTAKMRRYTLAVSMNRIVPLFAAFAKHQAFAKSSLHFRRLYGSGVPQGLTLGERLEYAAASPAGKIAIATIGFLYANKFCREYIMKFDLSCYTSPIAITPARIVTACMVSSAAIHTYYRSKYAAREAKLGIKWQWKKDARACALCEVKFPTTAVRKERTKHHCRMCGRVMCHACSKTYLFYPVEGKEMRTCDDCVKNGGPPSECILKDNSGQKSVLRLLYEQQKEMAAKSKAAKAHFKAIENKVKIKKMKEGEKKRIMELENDDAIILATQTRLPMEDGNLVDWGIKEGSTEEDPDSFVIFLPPESKPGQKLEVITELGDRLMTRIPREADLEVQESTRPRMIPIPGLGISKQWGKMDVKRVLTKVTVGYGLDGVMFAINKNLPDLVEVDEEKEEITLWSLGKQASGIDVKRMVQSVKRLEKEKKSTEEIEKEENSTEEITGP